MGLRLCPSHRGAVLHAALCVAACTLGCGKSEPEAATEASEAAASKGNVVEGRAETGDTQLVSSSQSSKDIDFEDLSGSKPTEKSPAKIDNAQAGSISSAPLTVVSERPGIDKYNDGTTHRRYRIRLMSDNSVVLHGPYFEYYRDGAKFKQGTYLNGLKDGRWGYWYPNGKVAKFGRYKLGEQDGKWVYRTKDGRKQKEEIYVNGKRDGTWLYYQKDSEEVARRVDWKEDKREGLTIEYYPDGQRKVSAEWQNDKLHGRVLKWYPEGKKLSYEEYADGKKNGRAIMWSKSGTIQAEFRYKDDRRVSGGDS